MKTRTMFGCLLAIAHLAIGSSPAFAQDFSGTWQLFANGFKGELYLTQNASEIRGWIGFNGVNVQQDVIVGSVSGKEIRFTRSSPRLVRPQEYVGYMLVANQPQIDAAMRMTGPDAIGGTFLHPGFPIAGWYAIRVGPYRQSPTAPATVSAPASGTGLAGAWSINAAGDLGQIEFSPAGSGFSGRVRFDVLGTWEALQDVTFDGRNLRFVRPRGGQTYTGTISGDAGNGSFSGAGSSAWTIRRGGTIAPVAAPQSPATVEPSAPARPSLVGAWTITAAGDVGRIEFSVSGSGFSGRVRFDVLGTWEALQEITFDGRALRFVRPRGGQVYSGTLSGDTGSGSFSGAGGSGWSMRRSR